MVGTAFQWIVVFQLREDFPRTYTNFMVPRSESATYTDSPGRVTQAKKIENEEKEQDYIVLNLIKKIKALYFTLSCGNFSEKRG